MRGRLVAVGMLVAACGDGASVPDAMLGSDGIERGRVTVHVEGPSKGFEDVYFQNADSSIALATKTNASGDASALMVPGGFVSVLDESIIYTWTDVQPGDELTLDLSFEEFGEVTPTSAVRIDPMDDAVSYYLFSRCESFRDVSAAIEAAIVPFFTPCAATSDLLVVAWDNSGAAGYRFAANANLASGGTIDMRGPYQPIGASVDVIGPSDRFISVRQKLANVKFTADTSTQVPDTHVVVPTQMPVIPGVRVQTVARTFSSSFPEEDGGTVTTESGTIVWGPASAMTTVDLTTPVLRGITSELELDPTSSSLHWTELDDGARGDVVWAAFGIGSFQWKVIGRRTDETRLRLPVLPRDDVRLRSETFFVSNFALVAAEGGYDRLRPYLLGHWNPSDGMWWPMTEPSGRASYRSLR